MARKSISKKIRFEVFKRDSFTCAYCGNSPPSVVLELDHIIPVSKNGAETEDNYATSCFDCNRGKGAKDLTEIPQSIAEKTEKAKEREEQLKEFKKFAASIKRRKTRDANKIAKIFEEAFEQHSLTDRFKNMTVKMFLDKLPLHEVEEAMEMAVDRVDDPGDAAKYFCGICWRKIKG